MAVVIKLTPLEMLVAGVVGTWRRVKAMRNGNDKNKHAAKSDWTTDIDGVGAEMAYAKWQGVYWEPTVDTFKLPDVGEVQVRQTGHSNGHLLLRRDDHGDYRYVLFTGTEGVFTMRGWIMGAAGKVEEHWREADARGEACWWVPQSALSAWEIRA